MRRFALVILGLLLVAACRPPEQQAPDTAGSAEALSSGLQSRIEPEGDIALGKTVMLVYILQDGEGVSGAEVELTGDMTHAGMVPVIVKASETEAGLYRADDFEFTMAGDWVLTAEITLPDGETTRAETSLTVEGR